MRTKRFIYPAFLIAILLLVGCTPKMAQDIAFEEHGVTLTDAQAQSVADFVNRPKPVLVAANVPRGTTAEQWRRLRECEASGNYKAVNMSGKYRGAYQTDRSFWLTYGGNPALAGRHEQASPAEQDAVAFRGYLARGWSPWPQCGRRLG